MVIRLDRVLYVRPKLEFKGFQVGEKYFLSKLRYGGFCIKTKAGTKYHENFIRTQIELGNFDIGVYGDRNRADSKKGMETGEEPMPELR